MQQILKTDLTNCDSEPIHIPGQIQPHGFLIALDPGSLHIEKVSANIEVFIGEIPSHLLGQPLGRLEKLIQPVKEGSTLTISRR